MHCHDLWQSSPTLHAAMRHSYYVTDYLGLTTLPRLPSATSSHRQLIFFSLYASSVFFALALFPHLLIFLIFSKSSLSFSLFFYSSKFPLPCSVYSLFIPIIPSWTSQPLSSLSHSPVLHIRLLVSSHHSASSPTCQPPRQCKPSLLTALTYTTVCTIQHLVYVKTARQNELPNGLALITDCLHIETNIDQISKLQQILTRTISNCEFYVRVSVHNNSILYKEPTRCNFGSIVY